MKKKNILFPLACVAAVSTLSACSFSFVDVYTSRYSVDNHPTDSLVLSTVDDKISEAKTALHTNSNFRNTSRDVHVYFSSDYADVPYVSVHEFLDIDIFYHDSIVFVGDAATHNGASAKFDVENNTVWFSDFDNFTKLYENGLKVPMDLASMESDSKPMGIKNLTSTYTSGGEITFDLSKYDADILESGGEVLLPFAYVNELFFVPSGLSFAFNGAEFYETDDSTAFYKTDEEGNFLSYTDYGKAAYRNASSTRSSSYASYFYYSTCFHFDYLFGKAADFGYTSADAVFTSSGFKSAMLSTNPAEADNAFAEFLGSYYDDGGHTGFTLPGFGTKLTSSSVTNGQKYWAKGIQESPEQRYMTSYETYERLEAARNASSCTTEGYSISSKTGIIRFDEFYDDGVHASMKDGDTYALFKKAFSAFAANSSVKNVVIDLSLNGGGHISSCAQALAFLHNEVTFQWTNPTTGSQSTETGYYTKIPSYGSKYKFYVLVSGCTFSAANAFACIAQENGWAEIIGENASGGGDCAVDSVSLADGTMYQDSSLLKMCGYDRSGSRISFDSGASIDHQFAEPKEEGLLVKSYSESFYSDSKLASFVESL